MFDGCVCYMCLPGMVQRLEKGPLFEVFFFFLKIKVCFHVPVMLHVSGDVTQQWTCVVLSSEVAMLIVVASSLFSEVQLKCTLQSQDYTVNILTPTFTFA